MRKGCLQVITLVLLAPAWIRKLLIFARKCLTMRDYTHASPHWTQCHIMNLVVGPTVKQLRLNLPKELPVMTIWPLILLVLLWIPMWELAEKKESSRKYGEHQTFAVRVIYNLRISYKIEIDLAIECGNGMEYQGCGSGESKSCGSAEDEDDINPEFCVEGCYCPSGTSLSHGVCVPDTSCPCLYNGKEFNSGSEIKQDCNLW